MGVEAMEHFYSYRVFSHEHVGDGFVDYHRQIFGHQRLVFSFTSWGNFFYAFSYFFPFDPTWEYPPYFSSQLAYPKIEIDFYWIYFTVIYYQSMKMHNSVIIR